MISMNSIFVRVLGCFLLGLPITAFAQVDSVAGEIAPVPDIDYFPQPDSFLLSPRQLDREPWIYSMDEALRNPRKVYKLSLKEQRLKEFPRDLTRFPNLQILDLSHNRIRHVPPSVRDLPHLQSLNLYNNRIKSLPDELRYLEHLQSLFLGKNQLVQIPSWVGGLSRLRALDLSYNHLTRYEIGLLEAMIPHCKVSY